jgi:hypothetical protein
MKNLDINDRVDIRQAYNVDCKLKQNTHNFKIKRYKN